ncbi:MAG TPA: hypothetical protein VFV86_05605 [Nitrososphaeraceae archaeon]|nr:hypothetical protein [Nitrososphaeraceae archaeon]
MHPTITSLHFVPIVVVRVPIIIDASFLSQSFLQILVELRIVVVVVVECVVV